jgi:hypothetical protein
MTRVDRVFVSSTLKVGMRGSNANVDEEGCVRPVEKRNR